MKTALSLLASLLPLFPALAAFTASRCVWVKDRQTERNVSVSLRGTFDGAGVGRLSLKVAASACYKAYLNGALVGWGPARTVKGYARIDEWNVRPSDGRNVLVLEVAGYGFESSQYNGALPFVAAELSDGGRVMLSVPRDFEAIEIPRRKDTPLYSRQRGFPAESYALDDDWKSWCAGGETARPRLALADVPAPRWLSREVPYPEFRANDGFVRETDAEGHEMWALRTIDTGLVELTAQCLSPGRLVVEFDEALGTNGVIDLNRNGDPLSSWHACYNRLVWDIGSTGAWRLGTMEPYTLKFMRIRTESGAWDAVRPRLVQCRNPHVGKATFDCSDTDVIGLFGAAKESLAQNAVDILTDCPGRERVGWLCDTFFSAETAAWLTGDFTIEREYLLNYTRTDSFGEKIPKGAIPGYMPASRGGVMPTYMMWYVIQCAAAAARMDDVPRKEFAGQVAERVGGILDWLGRFEREGLLEDLPGWVFVEWSKANDYVKGVNFPANMLWALALERAGWLLGRAEWAEKASRVREIVRRLSYDGVCFHDQAVRDGDGKRVRVSEAKTETCQYYAFFTSLAHPEKDAALWELVVRELGPNRRGHEDMAPSDAFIGYLLRLDVLARYGRGSELMASMKAYYGRMASESGTLWEFADGHDSRCHAIGGYIAVLLVKALFGIERLDWATRTISLGQPCVAMTRASCELPVLGGVIGLSVREGKRPKVTVPRGWTVDFKPLEADGFQAARKETSGGKGK